MTNGYVKIFRKIQDSRVWANAEILKLFIYCLIKANYKSKWVTITTGKGQTQIKIERGQFIYGRNVAGEELGQSPSTVRNNIKKLEKWGIVEVVPRTHYSIITIVNYSDYQDNTDKEGQPKDNQRTTKGQPKDNQRTQLRKDKKDKKGKEGVRSGARAPFEIIQEKICSAPGVTKETWRMKYGVNGELVKLAGEFAEWWIAKEGLGISDGELLQLCKRTGAVSLRASFTRSWLSNHKKYKDNESKTRTSTAERVADFDWSDTRLDEI